jgi:predicted nucleotidyltransferase
MIALIEHHRPEVSVLCHRLGVQGLDVFGSAADGTFDPARSDIDFLVTFSPEDQSNLFNRYFDLQESLEKLFDRKVDLVSTAGLSNPYFIASINRSRQPVYAAPRTQAA